MENDNLRILLIGNGGREHALAWKLSQSPRVEHIYCVPGNGGTASVPKVSNVDDISAEDFVALVNLAEESMVGLVIPGPEAPLVAGVVDHFAKYAPHIHCFGPSQAAARMEGSKTFSKDFMKKHKIPTAAYENFSSYEEASKYLDSVDHDVVIKADGLAAGKGVIIPKTKAEAHAALKEIMLDREFGTAGDKVVIEEYLEGDEISILSFSDGYKIKSLPPAQDHKRIGDGDTGPNTGGMGTYAPTPAATQAQLDEIHRTVLEPTIHGMRHEGYEFIGCLFTGFMITKKGPKVLEYNVRFGDPETQSLLPLLKSDLAEVMMACTQSSLERVQLDISNEHAATVVVAAGGYPGSYPKSTPMTLSETPKGVYLFHAGTAIKGGQLVTSGGRVIAATSTGPTLAQAVASAYEGVKCIEFDRMQFRKDIAARALR